MCLEQCGVFVRVRDGGGEKGQRLRKKASTVLGDEIDGREGISGVRDGVNGPRGEGPQKDKGQDEVGAEDERFGLEIRNPDRVLPQRTMRLAAVGGTGVPSPESAFSTANSAIFSTAHGKWASLSER